MLSINVKINYPVGIPLSAQPTTLLLQLFNGDINPNYFLFLRRWGGYQRRGQRSCPELQRFNLPHPTCELPEGKKPSWPLTELPCWGHRQQHSGSPALAVPFRRRKGSPESSKKPSPTRGGQPVASSLHGSAPKWRTPLQVAPGGQPRHWDHEQGYRRGSADPAQPPAHSTTDGSPDRASTCRCPSKHSTPASPGSTIVLATGLGLGRGTTGLSFGKTLRAVTSFPAAGTRLLSAP